MKRDQEVGEKCTDSRLSADRFLAGFASYLDVVTIKYIKDFKVLFEAVADLGFDNGGI